MPPHRLRSRRFAAEKCAFAAIGLAVIVAIAAAGAAPAQAPARTKLKPLLVPGQVLRYQIEIATQSATARSGTVQDPQGPSQLAITWDATVRLEFLAPLAPLASPKSGGGAGASSSAPPPAAVRIRTTYEKSAATVRSDTPDPQAAGIEMQYAQLAGRSLEFTLAADGKLLGITGLEDVVQDEKIRAAARQWIDQLLGVNSVPPGGVAAGQHWSSELPAVSLPLAGMVWHTDSTYLRNESCHPAGDASAAAPPAVAPLDAACAVVLTELSLVRKRALRDPTPDDYRSSGLRTSGTWSGSARSLSYISLETGWVVSTTQNGSERMDVTIARPPQLSMRFSGTVATSSSVSLAPAPSQ